MIRFDRVSKSFGEGASAVLAVDAVDLAVEDGEFLSIMGPSGSGKSTLLHLAGGIDTPTSGEVWTGGEPTSRLDDEALTLLRRRKVGFVFQFFNLLPNLTVEENIALPALIDGATQAELAPRIEELMQRVRIDARRTHRPSELSGGQMQRVAIARALILDPPILLLDEPTGNLDSQNGREVLALLDDLHAARDRTILLVTHDRAAAEHGDRVVEMHDGRLVR